MMSYSSAPRSLLLAGAFFGAFTLVQPRSNRPHAAGGKRAAGRRRAASSGIAPDRAARRQ